MNDKVNKKQYNYINLLKALFLYLVLFALYIEACPSMGNVWFRNDVNNEKKIQISGLISVIISPFKIKELWLPKNWDINFFVGVIIISLLVFLFTDRNQ